jgi:FxsC-like protein
VPHFFFSYSRDDAADRNLYRFYEDLRQELALRYGIPLKDAGFLDKNQPVGAKWNDSTSGALGTCDVFVPVYSANYFASPYCGQEWHAFTTRLDVHRQATGESLTCVLPIWWSPPKQLPSVADQIQDTRDHFGPHHKEHGLRYLRRLKEHWDEYTRAVVRLAVMLDDAGTTPPRPRTDIDLINEPNAFALEAALAVPSRSRRAGPAVSSVRRVTFVVAVGTRDQMSLIRQTVDVYGEDCEEWRPYHPACTAPIAARAQTVAGEREMTSRIRPADAELFRIIDEAEARRQPVVLIVDPWVIGLREYRELLERLNRLRSRNTAVIVPWESAETVEDNIRNALYLCLDLWADSPEPLFRDDVYSIDEFENTLAQLLIETQNRIIKRVERARRMHEAGPNSRPILTGPGS